MRHPLWNFRKPWRPVWFTAIAIALPFPTAQAADAPSKAPSDAEVLLQLLQTKGLITSQEADQVRTELNARSSVSADEYARRSIVNFSRWVDRVELHGDARMRFEYRVGTDATAAADDHLERNRWRYRLRAGARMQFSDRFRGGIQLESGPSGRSGNVTLGGDPGPWGKSADGLHIGLLYLDWTPAEFLSVTAGRQPNPFQTTSLVWDTDLTPEGLTESFKTGAGPFDLFATLGQYLYDEADPDNVFGSGAGFGDSFLFVNQVGARYPLGQDASIQVAPLLHIYAGQGDSYRGPFVGTTVANTTGVNDLLVLAFPTEARFKLGTLPVRVFGDFAVNLQGADRARAAGQPDHEHQAHAWQAGVEIGSARNRGGARLRAFYQVSDLYALDANLVDSDLFDGRLNMKGLVVQGAYGLTDYLSFSITYALADRKEAPLPTGAVGDLGGPAGTAFLDNYHLIQADLSLRF